VYTKFFRVHFILTLICLESARNFHPKAAAHDPVDGRTAGI